MAAAGSSTGEPYEKYQNRKGRKSAEKQEYRKSQEEASSHASFIQSSAGGSTPKRPRTRSRDKKSTGKGSKRSRDRSESIQRVGKAKPPPAKASRPSQASPSDFTSDGESGGKREKKRNQGKSSQSEDTVSEAPSPKQTLAEAADKSRKDVAIQHRSPLHPPAPGPVRDDPTWNVTGSLRTYQLSKEAAKPNRGINPPGHVPGTITTTLLSLKEVVKDPTLLIKPQAGPADKGPDPARGTKRLIVGVDTLPQQPDSSGAQASPAHTVGKGVSGTSKSKGKSLPVTKPAKPWVYDVDPGTGTTEPFYYVDGIPRPYFGWTYPDQMVGRKLGCPQVRAMGKPQEQAEFLGGRAEKVLREWQFVLDETDRPLDPSVLSNYSELVKCYSELNSHVERRRQDIVNCEGYAQNIIARGETLLQRFHERAMTELDGTRGRVLALEKDKTTLQVTVSAQARDLNALRAQVQGLQAKVKSHRTAVSEQNELRADVESLRQRNIKLDSELESHAGGERPSDKRKQHLVCGFELG